MNIEKNATKKFNTFEEIIIRQSSWKAIKNSFSCNSLGRLDVFWASMSIHSMLKINTHRSISVISIDDDEFLLETTNRNGLLQFKLELKKWFAGAIICVRPKSIDYSFKTNRINKKIKSKSINKKQNHPSEK